MYKGDTHVHSYFSMDSNEDLEKIFERAVELGFDEITITDHMDREADEKNDYFVFNIEEYLKTLNFYKEKYKGKLKIKIGMELGLQPNILKRYEEILKSDAYDFLIGSSHAVDGFDSSVSALYKRFKNKDELHRRYFETILENLEKYDGINTYGHLDYIRRYGGAFFPDHKIVDIELHKDLIDKILKKLIDKKIALEINTSGIRYGMGDFHPCREIVERYRELGGEMITIGSDAHKASDIGKDFESAREFLKSLGFKYFCVFTNKKPEFKEL